MGRGTFQCLQKVRHIRGGRPLPPDSPLATPCLLFFPRVRILTSVFPHGKLGLLLVTLLWEWEKNV